MKVKSKRRKFQSGCILNDRDSVWSCITGISDTPTTRTLPAFRSFISRLPLLLSILLPLTQNTFAIFSCAILMRFLFLSLVFSLAPLTQVFWELKPQLFYQLWCKRSVSISFLWQSRIFVCSLAQKTEKTLIVSQIIFWVQVFEIISTLNKWQKLISISHLSPDSRPLGIELPQFMD